MTISFQADRIMELKVALCFRSKKGYYSLWANKRTDGRRLLSPELTGHQTMNILMDFCEVLYLVVIGHWVAYD